MMSASLRRSRAMRVVSSGTIRNVSRGFGGDENQETIERDASEPYSTVANHAQLQQRTQLRRRRPRDVGRVRTERRGFRQTPQRELDIELLLARCRDRHAERRRWREQPRGAGAAIDVHR